MPRKPRQQRSKSTVESIVAAALIVLGEEGPKACSTRKIAERAGVGVGSLYEYFADRDAILQAVGARLVDDVVLTITPRIPDFVQMPVREAILALLEDFRALLQADDNRRLSAIRHLFALGIHFDLKRLEQTLTTLLMQYVMHHPELMATRNMAVMAYVYIHGGTFTVIRHLSHPHPNFGFDALAQGLADMVSYGVEGSLREVAQRQP